MQRYTADTPIRDVLVSDPATASVFERFGLGCPSCLAAEMETVQAVAVMHDVSVDNLLAALNDMQAASTSEDHGL